MTPAVALCARVDAEFHRLAYQALGIPVRTAGGLWWAVEAASPVLARAGTLQPEVDAEVDAVRSVPEIRDCFGTLRLAAEWVAEPEDPWMIRAPGPIDDPCIPGLTIHRALDAVAVLDFERAVIACVGLVPPGHVDGAIHPGATTAGIPQLHLLTGGIAGDVVGTALAAVTPCGVSIGAVATRKAFRGRGIGRVMTAAAVSVAPELPATLLASDLGYGVYRRLGFREVGRGLRWHRVTAVDES